MALKVCPCGGDFRMVRGNLETVLENDDDPWRDRARAHFECADCGKHLPVGSSMKVAHAACVKFVCDTCGRTMTGQPAWHVLLRHGYTVCE